jgi:hypothetical protein
MTINIIMPLWGILASEFQCYHYLLSYPLASITILISFLIKIQKLLIPVYFILLLFRNTITNHRLSI